MVTQPGLHDNDLVLWTQLLGEVLNAEILERLRAEHPAVRYSHGFVFQQLVEGPRPVGEVAENLGISSQAISKAARELEASATWNGSRTPPTRASAGSPSPRADRTPCGRGVRSARR